MGAFGHQVLHQGLGGWDGEREVRDAHLIQLQRRATERFAGMAGERQGRLLAGAEAQAHPAAALARPFVVVQPPAFGGVGEAVEDDLHAQEIAVKVQGAIHVAGANGNVRYGSERRIGRHALTRNDAVAHPAKSAVSGQYAKLQISVDKVGLGAVERDQDDLRRPGTMNSRRSRTKSAIHRPS